MNKILLIISRRSLTKKFAGIYRCKKSYRSHIRQLQCSPHQRKRDGLIRTSNGEDERRTEQWVSHYGQPECKKTPCWTVHVVYFIKAQPGGVGKDDHSHQVAPDVSCFIVNLGTEIDLFWWFFLNFLNAFYPDHLLSTDIFKIKVHIRLLLTGAFFIFSCNGLYPEWPSLVISSRVAFKIANKEWLTKDGFQRPLYPN